MATHVPFSSGSTVTGRCRRDLYYPYVFCVIHHTYCCGVFGQQFLDLHTLKKKCNGRAANSKQMWDGSTLGGQV